MPLHGEELRARLTQALSGRPEVLEAYLFGSEASGRAQPHSDVDVAVYVSAIPDAPYGYEAELSSALVAALGRNRVDVVVLNRAPPLLYGEVVRGGVRLFSRDLAATTSREGQALSRYCDWLPQVAKIDAAVRERIASGRFGR